MALEEEEEKDFSPPREDTGRRRLPANQEEGPPRNPNEREPSSWTCSLQDVRRHTSLSAAQGDDDEMKHRLQLFEKPRLTTGVCAKLEFGDEATP